MVAVDCNLFDIMGFAMKTVLFMFSMKMELKSAWIKSTITQYNLAYHLQETGRFALSVRNCTLIQLEIWFVDKVAFLDKSLIIWKGTNIFALIMQTRFQLTISWKCILMMPTTFKLAPTTTQRSTTDSLVLLIKLVSIHSLFW